MLNRQEIEYFKNNKHLITSEILELLRSKGNAGKSQALQILETEVNEKRYHLDSFGQPISFDGNKSLKKAQTMMNLHPIHHEEIEKCAKDFNHFRENYIRIKTPAGIDFPEIRGYQARLIDEMLNDKNEEVVGLIGRQCVDGNTVLEFEDGSKSTIKQLFDSI